MRRICRWAASYNVSVKKIILVLFAVTGSALAQVSQKPADLVIPVVGSTAGASNANFKTELQMTNPADVDIGGWLVYHPQGQPGSTSDRNTRYSLTPHTTLSYTDVVAALGAEGLGSLDVIADGTLVPTIVARAYDDQVSGTTGVTVPAVPAAGVLTNGQFGVLIAPLDSTRYRFNVGVRTLESGASFQIIVYDKNGTERFSRSATYLANYFEQRPGAEFAGIALQPDDTIEIDINAGSAIIYATTVDNQTNDSSLQLLRR